MISRDRISEDMLADKLKGHIYKMSHFQYAEVKSHIDPEMMYIVNETIYNFMNNITTPTYSRSELFLKVIYAVADVIRERESFTNSSLLLQISYERIAQIVYKAYSSLYSNSENSAYEVVQSLLPYIINDLLIQVRLIDVVHYS